MSLHIVKNVRQENSGKLINTIYDNFIDLSNYPDLKHTKNELSRLILSKNSKICFIMVNKKIAAYLIGEIIDLVDGRRVFYVNYLYTGNMFRKQGFASKLMKYVEAVVNEYQLNGVLLTCDTENQNVHNFYLSRGYMPDLMLRRYQKFDVLYKEI